MKKILASLMLGLMVASPIVSLATENVDSTKATEETTQTEALEVTSDVQSEEKQSKSLLNSQTSDKDDTTQTTPWEIKGLKLNGDEDSVIAFEENTLKLDMNYEKEGYQYKFVYSYNNWADWNVISSMSEDSEVKWTPNKIGTYKIYVDIKDDTGKTTTKTYTVKSKRSWTYTGINASKNMTVGKSSSISAIISGSGDLQYKFVYSYNNWADWGVIQGMSSKSTATFTPERLGTYEIYVDVKDKTGYTQTMKMAVNANYGWNYKDVECVSSANIDDTIEIKANASGETDGLKYKFVYSYNNWADWGVIQKTSEKNTASFKAPKGGKYDIYVDVVDGMGNTITKTKALNVNSNWTYNGVNMDKTSVVAGDKITITPSVTGNKSMLQYKFVYSYNNWSEWKTIKSLGKDATAEFVPTKAGKYDIYVDIKDTSTGQTITKKVSFTSTLGWTYNNITEGATITRGESVTITPNISGKTDGFKYKFVYNYEGKWADWSVFQKSSEQSTAKFTPAKAGKYVIYVDVTDTLGNTVTKTNTVTVNPDWSFVGVSVNDDDVDPGDTITITPQITGNADGLQYKFVYSYLDWADWNVIQAFGKTNTAKYKIQKSGYYDIYVDIKDSTGYTVTKSVRVKSAGGAVSIINADWFSTVNSALPRGANYTVIDVQTGKRFTVKRWAGSNHADCEPLTVKDTAILKDIYGGSFSWTRRPAIVLNGDKAYAASLTSMPHGDDTLPNNGFSGHICIHFLNSRTHGSNRVDPDHKAAVAAAAAKKVVVL